MADATNGARRCLGIAAESRAPEPGATAPSVPAAHRPPKRRNLGPGFQGIRTAS
ncbi:hypothetical protein ACWCXX_37600 [Streptomyces sp. NPDC001732]